MVRYGGLWWQARAAGGLAWQGQCDISGLSVGCGAMGGMFSLSGAQGKAIRQGARTVLAAGRAEVKALGESVQPILESRDKIGRLLL